MSDLKVDGVIASTGTNTNLTLQGKGSGKVAIGDGALLFPDADGSDGEFIKTDGSGALAFAEAGGGAWNLIGTEAAPGGSGTATLDVTGLDSTYDYYAVGLSDLVPVTDSVDPFVRFGDSGGVDSGGSDYEGAAESMHIDSTGSGSTTSFEDTALDHIPLIEEVNYSCGNATGEGFSGMFYLNRPGDGTIYPSLSGSGYNSSEQGGDGEIAFVGGARLAVITLDRVQFLFASGNVKIGRLSVWGLAHV